MTEVERQVIEMRRRGLAVDKIARAVRTHRRKVSAILIKHGLTAPLRGPALGTPYRERDLKAEAGRQAKACAENRLAEIPPDTRDLTGTILGDPLPGRSALDQMRGAE